MSGKSAAQNETSMFWKIASDLRRAVHEHAPPEEIADCVEEVEVMLMYTDSQAIKARCRDLLAEPREAVAASGG